MFIIKKANSIIKISGILFIFIIVLSSCISSKKINYIQDRSKRKDTSNFFANELRDYKVQENDYLYIKFSNTDEEIDRYLNQSNYQDITPNTFAAKYQDIYIVNDSGYINLPIIGKTYVKNYSIEQLIVLLSKSINDIYSQTRVMVKMANFHITVLGEVTNPGRYTVEKEKISVFEALGIAGDLTYYANPKKIKLIRQTEKGSYIYTLNLTKKDILSSDYYYLKPGDIIYAESLGLTYTHERTFPYLTTLSTLISSVSSILITLALLNIL